MTVSSETTLRQFIRQTWTTREDLRANRDILYLYGDNVEREGQRGLARQMRGEPNAHAISIAWGAFKPFTHATADAAKAQIRLDFEALQRQSYRIIVWPLLGIVPEFQEMPDEIRKFLRQEAMQRFQIDDPI